MRSWTHWSRPAASLPEIMTDTAPIAPETSSAIPQAELDALTDQIVEKLKSVFDPEIPVDIYELGLIYKVDVSDDREIKIDMTLTAPGCPVAGEMPGWVEEGVNEYRKRLTQEMTLEFVEIGAGKRVRNADVVRLTEREGEAMLAALGSS